MLTVPADELLLWSDISDSDAAPNRLSDSEQRDGANSSGGGPPMYGSSRREKLRQAAQRRRDRESSLLRQLHDALPLTLLTESGGGTGAGEGLALERANVVKLTAHVLLIYNWFSPELALLERQVPVPATLALHSQSLIAIVYNAVDYTLLFAPPSFTSLIGQQWLSLVGSRLADVLANGPGTGSLLTGRIIELRPSANRTGTRSPRAMTSSTDGPLCVCWGSQELRGPTSIRSHTVAPTTVTPGSSMHLGICLLQPLTTAADQLLPSFYSLRTVHNHCLTIIDVDCNNRSNCHPLVDCPSDLLGRSLLDFVHVEDMPHLVAALTRVLMTGEAGVTWMYRLGSRRHGYLWARAVAMRVLRRSRVGGMTALICSHQFAHFYSSEPGDESFSTDDTPTDDIKYNASLLDGRYGEEENKFVGDPEVASGLSTSSETDHVELLSELSGLSLCSSYEAEPPNSSDVCNMLDDLHNEYSLSYPIPHWGLYEVDDEPSGGPGGSRAPTTPAPPSPSFPCIYGTTIEPLSPNHQRHCQHPECRKRHGSLGSILTPLVRIGSQPTVVIADKKKRKTEVGKEMNEATPVTYNNIQNETINTQYNTNGLMTLSEGGIEEPEAAWRLRQFLLRRAQERRTRDANSSNMET